MERILKSYGEFCAEEISIRKALAGAAIGAGLALSSPAARTQVKAPEKAGIMKDVEAMKKDVLKIKIKKDIPVGSANRLSNYNFYDTVYQPKKEMSDEEVLSKWKNRIFVNKNPIECSDIDGLIEKVKRRNGRVYFIKGYNFPKEKMMELKDVMFGDKSPEMAKKIWKYIEKNHSIDVDFNKPVIDKEFGLGMGSQFANRESKTLLDETSFPDDRWALKDANYKFFVDDSDIKKCIGIVRRFESSEELTIKDMIAFYNLGLFDHNLGRDFEDVLEKKHDISTNIRNVKGSIGDSRQLTWRNFDYSSLMNNIKLVLETMRKNGVVSIRTNKLVDLKGRLDDNFVPVALKKGEEFEVRVIENRIVKLSSSDGRTLYMSLDGRYSKDAMKELEEIGDISKEKNVAATKSVFEYVSHMLDKYVEAAQARVDSFSKNVSGRTTVVRRIGKVKVVGASLMPFEQLRDDAEKELLDKLTGTSWNVRDTSSVTKNFEKNLENKEVAVLKKDDGEIRHISLSDFSESDLGTGPLKYGKDLQMLIDGRVKIGMDKERVRFALGDPDDIDRTASKSGYEEIYIYRSSDFHKEGDRFYLDGSRGESTYLYFEGGLLVSIMDR